MCGIVGIIKEDAEKYIGDFMQYIGHRGPDDDGIFLEKGIAFGQTRLSIVDLSPLGHQPMITDDGNYIIVFNGEIYNHLEIRETLIQRGYQFKGSSDTETLLNGFVEYGADILEQLNGIFAFALYNKKTNEVLFARDQFGVKPFYYFTDKNQFYFASELKALTADALLNKEIDNAAIMDYINYLYCPDEKTPFKQVKKLPAGHYIKYQLSTHQFEIKKYYEVPFNNKVNNASLDELSFELERKLFKAVERQLMSDVPVGFFLSGGLDSSLIAAIAQQLNPEKPITCFTVDSGDTDIDQEGFANDLYYAKLLSDKLQFNLHIVDAKIDVLKDFDKMIWHLDEPQADPAPLNVLNICKEARNKGIKVLLGGTAGDDLFSGYRRHQALNFEKYLSNSPAYIWSTAKDFSKKLDVSKPLNRRIRKFLNDADKTKLERMAGYFSWIPYENNLNLYSDSIKKELKNYNPAKVLFDLLDNIPKEKSDLNKMLYWEIKTFLTGHNLNYTDKMSMAVGVEARVPFLDLELVNFSTTIPPHLKLKGNTTKFILKKVAEKYLPHEIIYRPKSGFGAPVRKWITQDLDEMIAERLSVENIELRGLFDAKAVWELIEDNKKGKIDGSYTVWSLLAIESWMQQFVDGKKLF